MITPILPPEIKVIRDSLSVTRYVLPRRNLGSAKKVGWVPFGIGVFIVIFMIGWMSGPIGSGLHEQGVGRWLSIGFGLLGLPGLAFGLAAVALGVVILTNGSHAEIAVGDGVICAIERIGGFPVRRKRFVTQLVRLVLQKGGLTVTDKNRGTTTTFARDQALLMAVTDSGKRFWLVPGYPYEMLRPLADTLAASLALGTAGDHETGRATGVEVVECEAGSELPAADIPRPAETDITCQEQPHGLAISIPPRGLWKGSQGLFFFSLMWNGFMVVFTALMVKSRPPLPVYAFTLAFWAIGLVMLGVAINMARRKVLIAVVNNVLAYRVIGPFGTREQTVSLEAIETIRVGPSGMEVNDRPLMELQIIPRGGKKIGMLSNRSDAEREWLACVLRKQLHRGRESNALHT